MACEFSISVSKILQSGLTSVQWDRDTVMSLSTVLNRCLWTCGHYIQNISEAIIVVTCVLNESVPENKQHKVLCVFNWPSHQLFILHLVSRWFILAALGVLEAFAEHFSPSQTSSTPTSRLNKPKRNVTALLWSKSPFSIFLKSSGFNCVASCGGFYHG